MSASKANDDKNDDSHYDYKFIENKWQKKWTESKIFEPQVDKSRPKFFLTVPYPYTNGCMHIGHGRAFTGGDIFARYKRIRGYNVLFPIGFHITGTPVLATSVGIKMKDPVKVAIYRDFVRLHTKDEKRVGEILDSFKEPWNVVKYFAETMKTDMQSVGYSIDWRRRFTTGDLEYNRFITWQFTKFREKGFLTAGDLGILYSIDDQNAVGEDDIQDGDEKDLSIQTFSLMKFPFKDGYLVASTLRPETVFGATNIFVHPDGIYTKVKIKKNGEFWYIAKEAILLLNNQRMEADIIEEFPGKQLFGQFAKNLVDDRKLPVIPGTFVATDHATGVVYSVPGHAPFDWIAVADFLDHRSDTFGLNPQDFGEYLQPIRMIDIAKYGSDFPAKVACEQHGVKSQNDHQKLEMATKQIYSDEFYGGTLNAICGEFKGLKASEAKEKVAQYLESHNLYGTILITATKNLKTRLGGKVIVGILPNQHFLWYSNPQWKALALEALNNITISPPAYKSLFENTFNWLDKRPCARRRGLGTRFPFQDEKDNWIIESLSDSTIYMSFYTIKHLLNKHAIKPEQLILEFFDYIYLGKGKIAEVMKKTGISKEALTEMREEFCYWYPNDHRHTAIMHISNHLSFFIYAHAGIFPKQYWPKKITLIEPLIVEGEKMGKSKGNVIPLANIATDYGADIFRLYIAQAAEFDSLMDWRKKEVDVLTKHIRRVYDFFFELPTTTSPIDIAKLSVIEKAVINVFAEHIAKAVAYMENNELRKYAHEVFYETFNSIIRYQRILETSSNFSALINYVADAWILMACPVTPHLTEELWEHRGHSGYASVASWPTIDPKLVNKTLLDQLRSIEGTIDDVKSISQALKITQDQIKEITIIVAEEWKYRLYNLARELAEQNKIGTLIKVAMADNQIKNADNIKEIPKYANKLQKPGILFKKITQTDEYQLLISATSFIQAFYPSAKINIQYAKDSASNRKNLAEPTRFAIDISSHAQK